MKNQTSENRREFITEASKIVHEWNVHLEIFSLLQAEENSRQYLILRTDILAELWRAKRTCGAPWVSKSTHPRKLGNHVTVHRPPARPSAPQAYQCKI